MLSVEAMMNVNQFTQRAIVVNHVKGADVARALDFGEGRLVFAMADWRKEPLEILANFFEDAAHPDHLGK